MNIVEAIQLELDTRKASMPYGKPCASFDLEEVFIDQGRKRIYITLEAIKRAFEDDSPLPVTARGRG